MFVKRNNRLLVYLALFILADTYIKYVTFKIPNYELQENDF